MFTGLIQQTGVVSEVRDAEPGDMHSLAIAAPAVAEEARFGESVAVNGVCLTVERIERSGEIGEERIVFNAMQETMRRTALGDLTAGDPVNLELAMAAGERLGGHIVQGHVDGVGRVIGRNSEGGAEIWAFAAPQSVLRYTVEKGSICVDGISLTVASVHDGDDWLGGEGGFTVSILPQTRDATNLIALQDGAKVNLEADVIGKHVERLLGPHLSSLSRSRP